MNKRFIYLVLFLIGTFHLQAERIFVVAGATGNGQTWSTATGDLQKALAKATKGDEIWVSKGVYFPTNDNNRKISFHIKDGVALYGGFEGTESSINNRNIEKNSSILSGEIGTGQKTDNTFNVLYTANVTKTTIIDGFLITGGYAGGNGASGSRFSSGAGLYNIGAGKGKESSPTIRNCRFLNNKARDGAAVYNNASANGTCRPNLVKCSFQHNKAFLGGGAIFNNGEAGGNCLPVIVDNSFNKNIAGFGGAIFNYGKDGASVCQVKNSRFENNTAMMQGGGIFNLGTDGISEAKLTNCKFTENKAPKGSTVATSFAKPKAKTHKVRI